MRRRTTYERLTHGRVGHVTTEELSRAIEAVLLVAVEPVPAGLLAELLEEPVDRVEAACADLAADYEAEGRGFVLARIAGGYRFQTSPDLAPYVERFANREVSHRLSTAALETLAIVAYRQPVSRAQISTLRGVNVDGVVRLLEQRGLHRGRGSGRGPGPARPLRHDRPVPRAPRPRHASSELPPVEDFLPGPEVVGELEGRLRPASSPTVDAD